MSRLGEFFTAARERAAALPPVGELPPDARPRRSLRAALAGRCELAILAEFKRRSPSQGPLASAADPASYAVNAIRRGATALSVLTEPRFFDGGYDDLAAVRAAVTVPILAKDFIADPRQIAAAAHHGADAVLLILRGLADAELAALFGVAGDYGLDVIFECHDEADLDRALAVPDAIVGVNNRDLDTLQVDVDRALRLLPRVPVDRIAIAESGYRSPDELRALRGIADGVLIGSSLMRGADLAALVAGGRA